MTEANFRLLQDFLALEIPENHDLFQYRLQSVNSYTTATNYGMLSEIVDADCAAKQCCKPLLSMHQINTLHHKKSLHQWLAFSGPHSKISFHDFFTTFPVTNSGLFRAWKIKRWISGLFGTSRNLDPCMKRLDLHPISELSTSNTGWMQLCRTWIPDDA